MANPKDKPRSLKEQLAPLKAQLKAEETTAKKEVKPAAKTTPPKAPKASAPSLAKAEAATTAPDTTDADMVEFWRAAAGAVQVGANGREIRPPKKKPGQPNTAAAVVAPTIEDRETFEDLLDLSENTMKSALYEKEGAKTAPRRALSSKRVELIGLAPHAARERLLRFLKAAKIRGEGVVLVVFGPDPELRSITQETLDANRGALVVHQSDAGEPEAFKVTLG